MAIAPRRAYVHTRVNRLVSRLSHTGRHGWHDRIDPTARHRRNVL